MRRRPMPLGGIVIASFVAAWWLLTFEEERPAPRRELGVIQEGRGADAPRPRRHGLRVVPEEPAGASAEKPEEPRVAVIPPLDPQEGTDDESPLPGRRLDDLGRFLFESKLLSENGEVSCATCHDPKRQFADGLAQSKGILGFEVGANSPSLLATSMVSGFPGPAKDSRTGVRKLSLEERCVGPIVNPLEMGSTIEPVLAKLSEDARARRAFEEAYPGSSGPYTEALVGRALAAFVRSLRPEKSPYHRYLDGDWGALTTAQKAGLSVFEGRGRCNACHSGPALSDGLVHDARPHDANRGSRRRRASVRQMRAVVKEMRLSTGTKRKALEKMLFRDGGGYGGSETLAHTLPLWDVARTAPYFRDGSVTDLEAAVTTHIDELRDAGTTPLRRGRMGRRGRTGRGLTDLSVAVPRSLRPSWPAREGPPRPANLARPELESLLAFLKALSPARNSDGKSSGP